MAASDDWSYRRDVAVTAARAGAAVAMPHFRCVDLDVERKLDDSPVTVADRGAEAAIREVIREMLPDDGWLGEETGSEPGSSGYRWIVDPIDGTRNFVRGIPLWATLVACSQTRAEEPDVGAACVLIPALDECYEAYRDGGARCNGRPIVVSDISELDQALFCYETPGWFQANGLQDCFNQLCARTELQRGLCDAYGHMLVASGRAELVVEPQLSLWDIAATSLVVREAGGRWSDLAGRDSLLSGNLVVSNGRVHDAALQVIGK